MAVSVLAQQAPEYPYSSLTTPPASTPDPGTWAWERSPIEGFAWPTSVKQGETVTFYTSVLNPTAYPLYHIKIYRMGESSPKITLGPFTSHFYPLRAADGSDIIPPDQSKKPVDFKLGCIQRWAGSAQSYAIPNNPTTWQSGVYYALMESYPVPNIVNAAYFVVRSANPGTTSKILYKFPMTTYQAYTYWGGGSLYSCSQDVSLTLTDTIAVDRPWRPDFTIIRSYSVHKYFIEWAESNGYTMEYCDNTDVDKNEANFLSNYKSVVHVGHDEYWSGASAITPGERAGTENFRNAGGNLAFFAANTCYWRIFWIANAQGGIDYKRLKCKKEKCDGSDAEDDLWREESGSTPEAFFIGSQYQTGYDPVNIPAQVTNASHWIFKNTSPPLQNGNLFGLGDNPNHTRGILGSEIDNTNYLEYLEFPFLSTLEIIAKRTVSTKVQEDPDIYVNIEHEATYYEDTQSNARVFNAATIQWARGLAEYYDVNDGNRMKQITDNIVAHFSFKKYLGKIYADLIWGNDETAIQLDGDTFIQPGKVLTLSNNFTLTIDPGVTLYVDGTLSIAASVTIKGGGTIVTRGSGVINVANSSTVTIPAGQSIVLGAGSNWKFGSSAKLLVNGSLSAVGTSTSPIIFDRSGASGTWYAILIENSTAASNFDYCTLRYAANGLASLEIRFRQCNGQSCDAHQQHHGQFDGIYCRVFQPIHDSKFHHREQLIRHLCGFLCRFRQHADLVEHHSLQQLSRRLFE